MTLTRVGAIRLTEGADATKPIGQLSGTLQYVEFLATIDLASAAAASAANQGVAVTGLAVGDIPLFVAPAEGLTAGVIVAPLGPVSVANTLQLRVCNPTAGAVDAAAAAFVIGVLRPV